MKLSNSDIVTLSEGITNFPAVKVDQRNYRISDIIRRNQAGEQVMGDTHMKFDFTNEDKNPDFEKINPFIDIGFDLDDVIRLAADNGQKVTDLQNRYGELKLALDKAQQVEEETKKVPSANTVAPSEPSKKE